ncbi:MAG: glycosyltransferase family 4 protein [Promethearchaeota archaeon]
MNILFITPKIFPSISGGEFYIIQIARYLKKFYNVNSIILSSRAIDFKGVHNNKGRFISKEHPNYSEYMGIPIIRLNQVFLSEDIATLNVSILKKLLKKFSSNKIYIDELVLSQLLKNGPIFDFSPVSQNDNGINQKIKKKEPNVQILMDAQENKKIIEENNEKIINSANIGNLLGYFDTRVIQGFLNSLPFKIDLIHSTYLPYNTLLYGLIFAKLLDIPAVSTPFYHIFNPRYQKYNYTSVLKNYNLIFACSNYEKTFLQTHGLNEPKIVITPMGVEFNLYNSPIRSKSGKNKSFSKLFNIESPFVLFCGYKNYEKGAIFLLKSSVFVAQKYPDIYFVFIGPSTRMFDILLKKVKKSGVKVINLRPENSMNYFDWKKISAFQECSIFVLPSRSDAYGMVYLEAWAAEKPIIAARTPVMEEIIREDVDGLLVPFGDVDALSNTIIKLLNHPELARKLGKNGAKKVYENNNWKKIAEAHKNIYLKLVQQDHG